MLGPGGAKHGYVSTGVHANIPIWNHGDPVQCCGGVHVDSPLPPGILLYRPNGGSSPHRLNYIGETIPNRVHIESTSGPHGSTFGSLATTFRRTTLSESPAQFCRRMAKVENHMNEMGDSLSLQRLGKELHDRCETLKTLKGERIPK